MLVDQLMRALLKFALLVTVAIWIAAVPTQWTEAAKGSATNTTIPPKITSAETINGEDAYRVRPTLLVRRRHLSAPILWWLNQKLPVDQLLIASFVDSSQPDAQRIKEAAQDRYRNIDQGLGDVARLLQQERPTVLVIVGHSKDRFLIKEQLERGTLKESGSISLSDLQDLAAKSGTMIFFLTCRGAAQVDAPGPTGDLWTPEIVMRLKKSMGANTYGDFLAAMGSAENPTVAQGLTHSMIIAASEHEVVYPAVIGITLSTIIGNTEVRISGNNNVSIPKGIGGEQSDSNFGTFLWAVVALVFVISIASRLPDIKGYASDDHPSSPREPVRFREPSVARTLAEIGIANDPDAVNVLSRLQEPSNLKTILNEILGCYQAKILTIDETRARLYELAERSRPFPSRQELGLQSNEYDRLKAVYQLFSPPSFAKELVTLLMYRRRELIDQPSLTASFVNIARQMEQAVHESAAIDDIPYHVTTRAVQYQLGNGIEYKYQVKAV